MTTLQVTPDDLFKLADSLIEQSIDENIPVREARRKKFKVEIINKQDTWVLK